MTSTPKPAPAPGGDAPEPTDPAVEAAAETVEAVIRRHAGELLMQERLFDLYRGAPLAADEKSLAYRLVFGTKDRTLTEAEVDAAMAAVREGLAADLGAHIRS